MENNKRRLKTLCEIFLKKEDDYCELLKAINDFNQLLFEASKLEPEAAGAREHILLPSGKAIGTVWAAMCVKEILRTKYFIRGVYKGIKEAQQRFCGEAIHILYAGTGPFATLAVPFITLFSPQEINFTFLEINPESIKLLRNVITAFDAEDYINAVVQCDAAEYKVDPQKPVHMIITETMLNALQKEPQVAITMNLIPQMLERGILIPQNIKIEAGLLNPKKDMDRIMGSSEYDNKCCYTIGTIFELNSAATYVDRDFFPEVEIDIPPNIEPGYKELCLFTTIQVFGNVYLTNWQCSLNLPKKIMCLDQENSPVNKVSFQYEINENPGFLFKVIS